MVHVSPIEGTPREQKFPWGMERGGQAFRGRLRQAWDESSKAKEESEVPCQQSGLSWQTPVPDPSGSRSPYLPAGVRLSATEGNTKQQEVPQGMEKGIQAFRGRLKRPGCPARSQGLLGSPCA